MILYTLMPYELVFPQETDNFPKQTTIMYQGVPVLVEHIDPQTLKIVRVLSSDPRHYLNEQVSPGAKISLFNLDGLFSI